MKTSLKLLGLIPALLFSIGCEGKNMNEVNVIIISGQSNAVGCKANTNLIQSMGQAKYDEFNAGFEDIKISYNCWTVEDQARKTLALQNYSLRGDFVPVKLGQGNNTQNFGMEVGIAEALREKYANKLYIIKCACGVSNLNDYWSLTTDEMYVTLINYVTKGLEKLEKAGLKPKLRAFCWMQGEGDAWDGYYQFYYTNLVRFKEHLDNDLLKFTDDNKLPFIDGGIGPGPHPNGTNEWKYYKEVNEAKVKFADLSPTNIYIDTIAAGLHSNQEPNDDVHYDSESVVQLGHLFAQNLEQFLK